LGKQLEKELGIEFDGSIYYLLFEMMGNKLISHGHTIFGKIVLNGVP